MESDPVGQIKKGGTMRLEAYPCVLGDGSLAQKLDGKKKISERHRHHYEFSNEYRHALDRPEGIVHLHDLLKADVAERRARSKDSFRRSAERKACPRRRPARSAG